MAISESLHSRKEIFILTVIFIFTLLMGTVFYYFVESHSFINAFYLASMTMTTVGFGDVTPHTDLGKLFTAFYAFTGIGIFLGFANITFHHIIVEAILRRKQQSITEEKARSATESLSKDR